MSDEAYLYRLSGPGGEQFRGPLHSQEGTSMWLGNGPLQAAVADPHRASLAHTREIMPIPAGKRYEPGMTFPSERDIHGDPPIKETQSAPIGEPID